MNSVGFSIFKGVKGFCSILIFFSIVLYVISKAGQLARPDDNDTDVWAEYYAEENDTIDAIVIGSSAIYRYWIPTQAYEEQDFTSAMIASASQDIRQVPYIMEEAVKSQDADVIVVEMRNIVARNMEDAISPEEQQYRLELLSAEMNPSFTRLKMIYALHDGTWMEKLEVAFPLLKYHNNLVEYDRDFLVERLKNEPSENKFAKQRSEVKVKKKPNYAASEEVKLSDEAKSYIDAIEKKADELGKEVLLIFTPYDPAEVQINEQLAIDAYCEEMGYECLDLNLYVDEIGLDYSTDFYNGKHTNIAGARKFTSYLAKYLKTEYGLQENMTEKQRESWTEACKVWEAEEEKLLEKWEKNVEEKK